MCETVELMQLYADCDVAWAWLVLLRLSLFAFIVVGTALLLWRSLASDAQDYAKALKDERDDADRECTGLPLGEGAKNRQHAWTRQEACAMPFIHIKSLPFAEPLDTPAILEVLSQDLAQELGIALEHISATWDYFAPGHYVVGGKAARQQTARSHPLLVELFAPDFNSQEAIERMLHCIVASLARQTLVEGSNIFVHYRPAYSGRVFDAGQIVRW